jgi:hypothetical protein
MIRRCHARQWPTEHGRPFIPEPTADELACGCDHGPAPVATDYGVVAS